MEMLDPYLYPEGNNEFDPDEELFMPEPLGETSREEGPVGSPAHLALIQRFIQEIREKLDSLEKMVIRNQSLGAEDVERLLLRSPRPRAPQGRIIEGVFDGEHMMGADGKQYVVPQNYASKSKLVEGDILKLTIADDGTFIYKQIGPIERQRIVCKLVCDEVTGDYAAIADSKKWQILSASVTFYRAMPGDDVVVLVPKNAPSRWAAMENVMHRTEGVVAAKSPRKGRSA